MVIGQLLERSARLYSDKTAIVFEKVRLSYKEFNERVNSLANALLDLGIQHQDNIGIVCHNSNYSLEIIFACAKIGAIATTFNCCLLPKELTLLIEDSESKIIFMSGRLKKIYYPLKEILKDKPIFISIEDDLEGAINYKSFMENYSTVAPIREIQEQDVLHQIYTSGTTGRPKGAMLTHKNVIFHALTNIVETEWSHKEKFLSVLPLFHAAGVAASYINIIVGSTMVIQNGFKPEAYLSAIEEEKITRTGLVPTILASLIEYPDLNKYDLSSVKTFIYGAAPISKELLAKSLKCFKCNFYQFFGMTEMGPEICVLYPDDHVLDESQQKIKRLISAGRPKIGCLVRVIDENGQNCTPGRTGEIIASGSNMMKGYHKMPEETAKVIKDGWYYTGDMGYMDEDGYLYLVSRKSDMIISGGVNIYPAEIESCIDQLEDVIKTAVIGVPDEKWGESVKAIIVKKPGSLLSEEDVIKHCTESIAKYKRPKSVDFVESLPVNAMGKVLKRVLREKSWEGKERNI